MDVKFTAAFFCYNSFSLIKKTLSEYYVFPILGYFLLSVITYFVLYQFGFVENLPNSQTLNSGDAGFYYSIKEQGYQYSSEGASNSGFFPLFAYLWRWLHLDWMGISILNGLLFLVSLSFLCKLLKPDYLILGLFMASPYQFFMWVPLSESLFFLFCVAILYGIKKDNWKLIFFGVLLATMTRAVFLFFIPAFVGMSLMSQPIQHIWRDVAWKKLIFNYLLPCFLGLAIVVVIQYFATGKWFAYFEMQSRVWGRSFGFPAFPLGYRTPFWNLNGSYISFWIGTFTGVIGLKFLGDWFRQREVLKQIKNYELFSLIFICMSLMSILFFNAKWSWNWSPETEIGFMSTHFTGINRYIHPTVFFFVLLIYFFDKKQISRAQNIVIFLLTNLLWFCFDPEYYLYIQRYLAFLVPNLVVVALLLFHAFRWKILGVGLILTSMVLQSVLMNYFLGHTQLD